MATERRIYCCQCNLYVGTIRDASLIKGIAYLCPTHSNPPTPDSIKNGNIFGDFSDTFSDLFSPKTPKKDW